MGPRDIVLSYGVSAGSAVLDAWTCAVGVARRWRLAREKLTGADGGRFAPTTDLGAATVLAPTVQFRAMRVSRARAAGGELQLVLTVTPN